MVDVPEPEFCLVPKEISQTIKIGLPTLDEFLGLGFLPAFSTTYTGTSGRALQENGLFGRVQMSRRLRQPLPAQEMVMSGAVGLRPLPLPLQGVGRIPEQMSN